MMVRTHKGAPRKRGHNENDRASAVATNNDRASAVATKMTAQAVGGEHPQAGLGRMSNVMTAANGVGPGVAEERENR